MDREWDELLGAYALDAVDDDERAQIESYLIDNPRARDEVRQHREVASLLAFTGAPAPVHLWGQIAGAIGGEGIAAPPLVVSSLSTARQRHRASNSRWILPVAAAMLFGVIGLVAGRQLAPRTQIAAGDPLVRALNDAMVNPQSHHVELMGKDGSARVQAVLLNDGVGYMAGRSLPDLPPSKSWQLWGMFDGKMVSLGVLGNRPQTVAFACGGMMPSSLLLTAENAGGASTTVEPAMFTGEMI